jgi:trehalose 6-phosphate phosphatase
MPHDAATRDNGSAALFIDFDGLLREFAESPQELCLPATARILLDSLRARLDGALALISGRRIAELDVLLAPYRFCCAGMHGGETRDSAGHMWTHPIDARAFDSARAILSQLVARHPGLLLEDNGCGLALHFEHEPERRVLARTAMKSAADVLGLGFTLRAGKYQYDIHPSTATQANAIAAFMEQAPFRGRTPVLMGDYATDEDALAFVRDFRGLAVRVAADQSVSAILDAIRWLDKIPPVFPLQGSRKCGRDRRDF